MRKSFLLLRKSFLDLDIYFLSIIGKKINILRTRKKPGTLSASCQHNLSPFVSINLTYNFICRKCKKSCPWFDKVPYTPPHVDTLSYSGQDFLHFLHYLTYQQQKQQILPLIRKTIYKTPSYGHFAIFGARFVAFVVPFFPL